MSDMLDAALAYAARGWFVLPLNPASKVADYTVLADIEFDWITEVKPDAATIRRWFDIVPDLNIGIRMRGSGLTVVDIDDLARWCVWYNAVDLVLPKLPTVDTAKGRHYFFKASPRDKCGVIHSDKGEYVGDCLTPNPPHWKPSDRAYVVAPPSIHPAFGTQYEWVVIPEDGEWIELPGWIREAVIEPSEPHSW